MAKKNGGGPISPTEFAVQDPPTPRAAGFIRDTAAALEARLAARASDPNIMVMPKFHNIEVVGEGLIGVVLGHGAPAELGERTNPETGEIETGILETFVLDIDGYGLIRLNANHQLREQLPLLIGRKVEIVLLERKQIGKRQVKDFHIAAWPEKYTAGPNGRALLTDGTPQTALKPADEAVAPASSHSDVEDLAF